MRIMLTKEETLVATLAAQIYSRGRYSLSVVQAVNAAKDIIEASKETEPKAGLTPIQRKKLVRKVREF